VGTCAFQIEFIEVGTAYCSCFASLLGMRVSRAERKKELGGKFSGGAG
jgi:hypothetical protein